MRLLGRPHIVGFLRPSPVVRTRKLVVGGLRGLLAAAGLAAIAALSGCVTRAPLAQTYDGPRELPSALAARFAYEPEPLVVESDPLRERRRFDVHEIVLPGVGEPDAEPISFEYYDVEGDAATPIIVVLPIVNGNLIVSRYFARYFVDQGWAVAVLDREGDPLDHALEDPEHLIRRNLLDYLRVLDWAEANPEFDAIGVFGISFGGMAAVMLAALDDRIDAVVAAMAGGDLPYLMTHTSYRSIARQVHRALQETGMSRSGMRQRLDELISTDPLALAPYVDAEDVMLVMTRTDMIVPFETQQALRARLGRPETLYLPTGHRTSVIYFPLLRSSAYDFFARQFASPN